MEAEQDAPLPVPSIESSPPEIDRRSGRASARHARRAIGFRPWQLPGNGTAAALRYRHFGGRLSAAFSAVNPPYDPTPRASIPTFTITSRVARALMRIEAAREAVGHLPITPSVLATLRGGQPCSRASRTTRRVRAAPQRGAAEVKDEHRFAYWDAVFTQEEGYISRSELFVRRKG